MNENNLYYLLVSLFFFIALRVYFRVANHYNIIDRPNERSSHTDITIRGGGVVFLLATLVLLAREYTQFHLLVFGLLCAGGISFIDDINSLPGRVRLLFHFAAVTLLFQWLNLFSIFPWYILASLYILVTGIINACNFMDGINGMTGIYILVMLASLQWVNIKQVPFMVPEMIWLPLIACLVFLFFNFRKKAACFAGDVGSVTSAFWVLAILFALIIKTGNWSYFLFFSVYGVDSVLSIVHRLWKKENIFLPHRSHFYQLLANEQKIPHLYITLLYGLFQTGINIWIIKSDWNFTANFLITCVPLALIYILVKPVIASPL